MERIEPVTPSARPIPPIDSANVRVRRVKRRSNAGEDGGRGHRDAPRREGKEQASGEEPQTGERHIDIEA